MITQRKIPANADELRQMSPAEWFAMKERIVRQARMAQALAVGKAIAWILRVPVRAGRAIASVIRHRTPAGLRPIRPIAGVSGSRHSGRKVTGRRQSR